MTDKSNSQHSAAAAETLIEEIYFKTLRALNAQLDEGKVSANLLSALSKFLAENEMSLAALKERTNTVASRVADEVDGLELDEFRDKHNAEQPFKRFSDLGD